MESPESSGNRQIAAIESVGSISFVLERLSFETIDQKRERLFLEIPIDSLDLSTDDLSRQLRQASASFLEKRFG
jgi:hypothetical protein